MKFKILEKDIPVLRKELINIASRYLHEDDKGLFVTTTNTKDDIDKNIIIILKSLLGEKE